MTILPLKLHDSDKKNIQFAVPLGIMIDTVTLQLCCYKHIYRSLGENSNLRSKKNTDHTHSVRLLLVIIHEKMLRL